jgi:hypothetical protein
LINSQAGGAYGDDAAAKRLSLLDNRPANESAAAHDDHIQHLAFSDDAGSPIRRLTP